MDGPLFFGSVTRFNDLVSKVPPQCGLVLVRMRYVPYLDQSGLYALESALKEFAAKGIQVYMTGVKELPRSKMQSLHIIPGLIQEDHLFDTFENFAGYISQSH